MLGIISLLFNFTVALNLPNVRLQTCRRKNRWNDLFKQVEKSSFSSTSILSFHHTFSASWKCSLSSFTQKILRLLCVPSGSLCTNKNHPKIHHMTCLTSLAKSLWPNESEWSSPGTCRSECPPPPGTRLTSRRRVPHPNCWRSHAQQIPRSGLEAVTRLGRDPSLRWLAQPGWLSSIFLGWFLDGCCKHPFWNDTKMDSGSGLNL